MPVPARMALMRAEDLRLNGHVEGGCRLVGKQDGGPARERRGDHHALAHPARELERVLLEAPVGLGDADGFQHGPRLSARLDAPERPVRPERLDQLVADGHHRVERAGGLLEDDGDAGAANAPHLGLGQGEEVGALEHDATAHGSGDRRKQTHDCQCGQRLPAAALADERENLSCGEIERHAVDHPGGPDGHAEPVDREGGATSHRKNRISRTGCRWDHPAARQLRRRRGRRCRGSSHRPRRASRR